MYTEAHLRASPARSDRDMMIACGEALNQDREVSFIWYWAEQRMAGKWVPEYVHDGFGQGGSIVAYHQEMGIREAFNEDRPYSLVAHWVARDIVPCETRNYPAPGWVASLDKYSGQITAYRTVAALVISGPTWLHLRIA